MGAVYKIEIYQVKVTKNSAGSYDVNAAWRTEESPQPYSGSYRMEIVSMAGVTASGEFDGKTGRLSKIAFDSDTNYSLRVTAGEVSSAEVALLTHTYKNAKGNYDGTILKLHWDTPSERIGLGRCYVDVSEGGSYSYDIPFCELGMEIPIREEFIGENAVLTVSLEPYTSPVSAGPTVTLEALYCSRYVVSKEKEGAGICICYKKSNPKEKSISVSLSGEIYGLDEKGVSKKPEKPVASGSLELGITAPYTLTVKTDRRLDRKEYDTFVQSVCEMVTPAAMYEILEMITRCCLYYVEDSLYFHCGLRPVSAEGEKGNQRCADVRPGFLLRVEQETYMPKEYMNGEDAAGFVGIHTAEYLVSITRGESMQYLEFDSFVAGMDEEIYPPQGSTAVKPIAGGIIDLCAVRMRSPFYRIQYPDGIYSSDALPDVHAENHTRLIAEAGWNYLPSAVSADTGAASLLFRGRSALSLLLSVRINGVERRIPVGMTFGKILPSMGIYGAGEKEVKWYRRGPDGREAEICFTTEIPEDMPLMHGDRIEG